MDKIFTLFMLFPIFYLMFGRVFREEFIRRGWHKYNASLIKEIVMAPIFTVAGLFFFIGMIGVGGAMMIPALAGTFLVLWLIINSLGLY